MGRRKRKKYIREIKIQILQTFLIDSQRHIEGMNQVPKFLD